MLDGDETRGDRSGGPEEPTVGPARLRPAAPPDTTTVGEAPPGAGRRRRLRYAHALRRKIGGRAAVHRVRDWSRRPGVRLATPGLLLMVMIAGTGTAGAILVPATAKQADDAAATSSPSSEQQPPPPVDLTAAPTNPADIGGTLGPTGAPIVRRPADVLKTWAGGLSTRVGVPATALEAYGYAELVLGQTLPACGLKWTTLAAIGKVESGHGSANGATLLADGRSLPAIYGPPLDGSNGTMRITDTDNGRLDGDGVWDRAVGPMQFIPTTWERYAVDADNDGMQDPSDVDDAALAAGNYLCQGGRNLTDVGDWWAAILTYNAVQPYARSVYDAANEYGTKSRT